MLVAVGRGAMVGRLWSLALMFMSMKSTGSGTIILFGCSVCWALNYLDRVLMGDDLLDRGSRGR